MKIYLINGKKCFIHEGELFVSADSVEKKIVERPKQGSKQKVGWQRKDKSKPTEDVIRGMIKEIERGKSVREVCKEYDMIEATFYNRRARLQKSEKQIEPDVSPTDGKTKYHYECSCGINFTSTIEPSKIKCPDCGKTPKLESED